MPLTAIIINDTPNGPEIQVRTSEPLPTIVGSPFSPTQHITAMFLNMLAETQKAMAPPPLDRGKSSNDAGKKGPN